MENENEKIERNMEHVKCTSCGGEMVFDPEAGMLVCPYCKASQKINKDDAEKIEEHDFKYSQTIKSAQEGKVSVIHCKNCGAEITADEHTTAKFCPFCGSPMVIKIDDRDTILPEAVVPFKITEKSAKEFYEKWVRSRFFSPRSLKKNHQVQKMKGVYVPHFTYDTSTYSSYTADAGTYYYVTETYTEEVDGKKVEREHQVRKTSWRPVNGNFSMFYDDVLVNASKNVDRKLIDLTYNLNYLVPYKPEYIYGFLAENYSVSKEECWNVARNAIDTDLATKITDEIEADEVRNLQVQTCYQDIKFKEILLPIWISVYTYKNKIYKFMVNGETGEVKGTAPLSPLKILLAVIIVGIIVLFLLPFLSSNPH